MGERLLDHFSSTGEFECCLEDARMSASTDREEEFVASLSQKYKEWGHKMFLSEAQNNWLRTIAGPED